MIRRSGAGRLHEQSIEYEEDINPMEGTSSIADVMLVLAVGMMLAVVINWNVDINKNTVREIDDPQQVQSDQITDQEGMGSLTEKGKVYYDENTGKYYTMLTIISVVFN